MKNIKEYENIKDMVIDVSSKRRNQTIFIKNFTAITGHSQKLLRSS